jgi:hypothetical protein
LNNPNSQVVVGDAYGYYNYVANTLDAFSQFKFSYDKVDFYQHSPFPALIIKGKDCTKNGIYETIFWQKREAAI